MVGTSIAHYHITAKLGQGGMGEVYRATDTKLDREVAIKVLPESFAQDKERLARFEREAKVLASLNHPGIAAIHGLEQTGQAHALVMELVEGEDLSLRLKRGALPIEEVLDMGKQIAEALEAAHGKGIIHRDLKPANIKVTSEGQVKVLDFGLAKAEATETTDVDSDSPTLTADHTLPGTLLGTAGYMSPEQARGKVVDKRSDIWSFGVVLFECLTGERLFTGETVTDSIGALLHREIDWDQLPSNTPPAIELLLRKCLARDRKRRLPDIGVARLDLEQAIADPESALMRRRDGIAHGESNRRGVSKAMVVGIVLVAIGLTWLLKPAPLNPPSERGPIRRLSVDLGTEAELVVDRGSAVRISPDGTTLAFIGDESGIRHRLYLRRLDELKATPLEGTDGVGAFSFSPEGQRIALSTGLGFLQTISVRGGSQQSITRLRGLRSVDWGEDGKITFGQWQGALMQVPSSGGQSKPLTRLGGEEVAHRTAQVLPGEQAVLFTSYKKSNRPADVTIMVQRLPDGTPQEIKTGVSSARYLSSGHLVYLDKGRLFAAAFDLNTLTIRGESVPVVEDILYADEAGAGHFDISSEGTLVYATGRPRDLLFEFVWVYRDGRTEKLKLPADNYGGFRLSPDGKLLAYGLLEEGQEDLWIYDVERQIRHSRLTTHDADDHHPVWSPSGKSIAFVSSRRGMGRDVYWKRVGGSSEASLLAEIDRPGLQIWTWHPTRNHLLMFGRPNKADIQYLPLAGDDQSGWTQAGEPKDLAATPHTETHAMAAPNGKWFSYRSKELGDSQIFVQRYPPSDASKQRASVVGASSVWSFWHPNKNELFFTAANSSERVRQVFSMNYKEVEGELELDDKTAKPWKNATYYQLGGTLSADIDPSQDRLLLRQRVEDDSASDNDLNHVIVFENFFDYLNEKVPIDPR